MDADNTQANIGANEVTNKGADIDADANPDQAIDTNHDAEPSTGSDTEPDRASMPREINGPKGPEPTRFGDWEQKGRCSDF